MRGRDAFFCYVGTPTVAQQIGAVVDLDPRPDGRGLTRQDLHDLLERRLPAMPTLRQVPVLRGRRRPGWLLLDQVEPAPHVREHRLPPDATVASSAAVIDRFWTDPVTTDRPPWQMLLVTGAAAGRTTLAVKLHHCLGDGRSVIGTVVRLLDPVPGAGTGGAAAPEPAPTQVPGRARARGVLRRGGRTVRGLLRLAAAGRAPLTVINRPLATPRRRLLTTTLPAPVVSRAARALGVHTSELACGLVAEALHRTYPGTAPPRLRAMFPVSRRDADRAPAQGNWTGAVALDLPTGPVPVRDRVMIVRDRLREGLSSGEPAAADLVMRVMGRLPGALHAAVARRVYRDRFMNVIVSYLSGPARPRLVAGAPVRTVAPVVGLADGVPIGVGVLRWADTVGIGVLLDGSLAALGEAFVSALHDGFDAVSAG
jgi:WS/DGAT/MGAT family acyltransferase